MKQLILLLVLVFSSSCVQDTIHSQQQPTAANEKQSQAPEPAPPSSSELSDADSRRLEERLPKKVRDVIEQAEQLELFDLNSSECYGTAERNKFQGCAIRKKVVVRDPDLKKQITDRLIYAVGSGIGLACFEPRHGLRAVHKGERVDLIICFACEKFQGESTAGKVGGGISTAVEELFIQTLANAKRK